MSQDRIVNIDLHKVLGYGEVHLNIEDGEPTLYALISFRDLRKFTDILGEDYFCEGGVDAGLHNGYISIRIDDIIEEVLEHDIRAYREAISEYERYIKLKRRLKE